MPSARLPPPTGTDFPTVASTEGTEWAVLDDVAALPPVTEAEVLALEAYLGDVLETLLDLSREGPELLAPGQSEVLSIEGLPPPNKSS